MKKKFAFILMGDIYDPEKHQAKFETVGNITYINTVRSFEEAKSLVLKLAENGIGAVELCGAFGAAKAQELIDLTDNKVAIGYVVHKESQDALFAQFFGD